MIEHRDRVLGKAELFDRVWPGVVVEENNLQVQVSSLRKLLGPGVIATVAGRGYRFVAEVDGVEAARPASTPSSSPTPTPSPTPACGPCNLPQPRTRFIGRETPLADCERLLEGARLLTLTGIGGCGKTRMALELGQRRLASSGDEVWFVDMAPLPDGQRVVATVAAALGIRQQADLSLIDQVVSHLASRRVSIVLDNCERVIAAVADMVEAILANCRNLRVLATSREALGLSGEQIYPLPSMSLPGSDDLDAVQRCEAAQLFVDRARLALPDFDLNAGNAAAIAQICRRLDGIALAIELAAARVRVLSVDEIRSRLDDRFRLLTGGERTLLRHQTLQAAMQWSYDQLSAREQAFFRQLAVFAGGSTLAAAVAVAGIDEDEYGVLELLTQLHDKSLLVVDREAEVPRYRMLETVREYAQQRLIEAGEVADCRTRHLRHCVRLAEDVGPRFQGPGQVAALAQLRPEHENLLAAQAWCERAPAGAELGLRLISGLLPYWMWTGQTAQPYGLAQAALAQVTDGTDRLVHARGLRAIGWLAYSLGRHGEAHEHARQCVAVARGTDNRELTLAGLTLLGKALESGGQPQRARAIYEEVCAVSRALGDQGRLGLALNQLAELNRGAGDLAAAEACYRESIGIMRAGGDARNAAIGMCNLAGLLITDGRLGAARAMLAQSLTSAGSVGPTRHDQMLLDAAAGLASRLGDHVQAAHLHGASLARLRASGTPREPVDDAFIAPLMAQSREALGTAAFEAAEAAGRAQGHEASMAQLAGWLRAGD